MDYLAEAKNDEDGGRREERGKTKRRMKKKMKGREEDETIENEDKTRRDVWLYARGPRSVE